MIKTGSSLLPRWHARAAWLAAALLACSVPALAVDFFGYFRDSGAGNSRGGGQACFKTPGMDYKLRLGNECDTYGEWGLQESVWKDKAGVEFTVGVMAEYDPDASTPNSAPTPIGVAQNYVKARFPQLGGVQFWAGRQYYRRENIEMLDFYYLNTSEPGAGVEDVPIGAGKLAASVFVTKSTGAVSSAFWRPDLRVYGVPVNPGGTLTADLNVVLYSRNRSLPAGQADAGASPWLTVEHIQENVLGGSNKLALQWASGAAAQMDEGTPGFGPDPLHKGNRQFRVLDQLLLQPSLKFQVQAGTVLQWKTFGGAAGNARAVQTGFFARPVYYLNDYFKLQGDAGITQNKIVGGRSGSLFKCTFAPTLTPTPGEKGGFFVRPEIRAFITYGRWNGAAADATDSAGASLAPGGGLFGGGHSGFSFGTSVETWF